MPRPKKTIPEQNGQTQTTGSEYHWYTFSLRARLGF